MRAELALPIAGESLGRAMTELQTTLRKHLIVDGGPNEGLDWLRQDGSCLSPQKPSCAAARTIILHVRQGLMRDLPSDGDADSKVLPLINATILGHGPCILPPCACGILYIFISSQIKYLSASGFGFYLYASCVMQVRIG